MTKGRPRNAMTQRRQQVLAVIVASDTVPSWSEIARRCGLHDYRSARRIAHDLERMGRFNNPCTAA